MNIIAIYPGRFQPFGRHHAESFKWLQKQFGPKNTYIATSNVVNLPKSPLDFKEKKEVISQYGLENNVILVKNPYKAEELLSKYNPKNTAVVFMVGQKDMDEDPRFSIGKLKSGNPTYFQDYSKNKNKLQGYDKHGYLIVAPHVSLKVPLYGEMSGTTIRKAIASANTDAKRKELFTAVFGWYDAKLAKKLYNKFNIKESVLDEGLIDNLKTKLSKENLTKALNDLKRKVGQESAETKEAFNLLVSAIKGNDLSSQDKTKISDQLKDLLRTVGLGTIAVIPGGAAVMALLKLLKLQNVVLPSSFRDPVEEGYMTPKQNAAHVQKLDKLKDFLDKNRGREFVYDFNEFPKTVYGVKIEEKVFWDNFFNLVLEGGAGGHMAHPFDIPSVTTGNDLIDVFNKSVDYLSKKPASVKIDGVNASIRLVTLNNKLQFVMDRGSNKPLDVKGITKAELEDRFGAGHGMIKVGGTVLDIFNDALATCKPELKTLGLLDNPNIMFNIEYVAGSTNVLSYGKNFLAIHGLLEITQVTEKKRATNEIPYNKPTMQKLLNKLNPVAQNYGYEVLGSIPTTLEGQPEFSSVLNTKYTVNYGTKKETKTLKQWLASAKVPRGNIKTVDGKSIAALSKEVLLKISEGTALNKFIENKKDYKDAIDGFVIYIATMKLGDAVLEKLTSPLGPVAEHEGIVIRDPKIYNKPFKITGKFIVGGLATSFRK